MLAPGESLPNDEVSPTAATTILSTATERPTPASTLLPAKTPGANSHHLSSGSIAGIAVGGVVAVAILGVLLFLLGRNTALLQLTKRDRHTSYATELPLDRRSDPGYGPPYSPDPVRYGSPPPMDEYKPYGYGSVHQLSAPVAELPSPPLRDQQRPFTPNSDGQADDDLRRRTITPPLSSRYVSITAFYLPL